MNDDIDDDFPYENDDNNGNQVSLAVGQGRRIRKAICDLFV